MRWLTRGWCMTEQATNTTRPAQSLGSRAVRAVMSRWGARLDYLGGDGSEAILEIAREMGGGRYARCDLLRDELPDGPLLLRGVRVVREVGRGS